MADINSYLRENLSSVFKKNIFIAPEIDDKKLNNAVKSFGFENSASNVIALFDSTRLGSGKDGILFTGEKIIYKPSSSDPISIRYESISSVEYIVTDPSIEIKYQGNKKMVISDLPRCDYARLSEVLSHSVHGFDTYSETKQLIAIDEMDEAVKVSYVKVIINMAFDDDGVVDEQEFAELLLLMTRLNLNSESRFELRSYMASIEKMEPIERLLEDIDETCPGGQSHAMHISLTKDLINLHLCTGGSSVEDFQFLHKYRHLLKVNDEEVELATMVIKNDHDMLRDDVSDEQIVSAIKALSAKAAAVGTPLAAVYLSGSVIGMSAAGMTSGLATLGMGGILGLSSMATGIGVAVLIGVGAYAGIKKLTGANEISRFKRRELMLNEVIKQTQATISLVIDDINYVTNVLSSYIAKHDSQGEQIKKLMRHLSQIVAASAVLTNKSDSVQGTATKLRCAQYLNLNKLKSLTREPTKLELYDFIVGFYEERVFVNEVDGKSQEVVRLAIKKNKNNKDLELLANSFEAIGYFNVSDVLKGSASDKANKAKNKIKGIFS